MRKEAWSTSARLAWQRPRFRALALLLLASVSLGNIIFLARTIPVVREGASAIVHYNVYLGIDDVRDWPWIFLWPAVWQGLACLGLAGALGSYQKDPLLAYGMLGWLFAWSLPWAIGLSYLLLFNLR